MRVSFLLLVFAILGLSCNKTDDKPPHVNTFSATLDGTAFVPYKTDVGIDGATPGTRAITVVGLGSGVALGLYMYEYNGTKSTFTLGDIQNRTSSSGYFCSRDCQKFSSIVSGSNGGEIVIDSFDKTSYKDGEVITGTFQFQTDDYNGKYNITNGHFSVFVPN